MIRGDYGELMTYFFMFGVVLLEVDGRSNGGEGI